MLINMTNCQIMTP